MSSIGGFDTFGSAGALQLLSNSGSTGGIFGALSGGGTSPSPTISTLGVSNPLASASQTIQQLTQGQSIQTQKNSIYKTIADRINAIAAGQLQPSADWEKLGGYYAAQGIPFVISLNSKGQPQITSQDQMDASHYSVTQRNTLGQAVSKLLDLGPQVQANTNYDNLKNQWGNISVDLVDIKNNNIIATTDWQQQAASIMAANHPISFSLDANGTVTVQDQTVSTFEDQDPSVRGVLTKAARQAGDAVATDLAYNTYLAQGLSVPQALQDKETQYSQLTWVSEASSLASMGIPYTLGVDTSQTDTSVNYVTKTEKTTYSNALPTATNSFTINNGGTDGYGYPDTTTDATNPQPYAASNRIITNITDGSGNAIPNYKYTNPVTVVSSAANALAVTDTITGKTDAYSYDGAGTVTVTTTNKQGAQIGLNSYSATGLAAVASEPPTVGVVDGSGKSILALGSGLPITYSNPVTVNAIDQYNMTVTNSANGNVDTYSTQLDGSNNPIQDAKGNYLLSVSHTDSLGRTVAPTQTLTSAAPGVNGIVSQTTNSMTIAADGAGTTTTINNQTILPMDKFSTATGSNGNKLSNVVTDGSGNALGTYTNPVSITNSGAGNVTVTDKLTGNVDTYTDNGNNTISIVHKDSAGDVIKTGATVAGAGLNALVAQTPTLSFTDGSGNPITLTNGATLPSYSNPVTYKDNGAASPDKSFTITDSVTGYTDQYSYASATSTLTINHNDSQGNLLYSQTANGVNGINAVSSPLTITDSSGNALSDTLSNPAPTYTNPVSVKDAGGGNFSVTDSTNGYVDLYAYDSQAQTLTISHNDNANNTLSTQTFTGVAGIGKPWVSMADANSSSWTVTPPPATVTDASGNPLTDSLGAAAPSYSTPVTVADSGGGAFSVTNNATGYVDKYAYDSASQALTITHYDNANNALSSQNFSGVTGIKTPWAAQQAASPTNWSVGAPSTVTDSLGGTLLDTSSNPAPTYTNPVTVADSGGGTFAVTDTVTGNVDQYAYDSAAQTLSIVHNDGAGNSIAAAQNFTGVTGIAVPWASQQAASPTSWAVTPTPVGITDSGGGTLLDSGGTAAPTYTDPISIKDSGGGKFAVTDTSTGNVDLYAYDSAAQTLSIAHNDNAGNTLSTQNFTGVTGIAGLNIPAASLQPNTATTWDVFNKTTLNSQLTSISSYSTSYDTSSFDMTNPASHVATPAAYTSTTTFSYTSNNVTDPTLMQGALPNLKLNYVVAPKITVTPVTDVPMPASVEAATPPYDISTTNVPKWQSDAIGYMKAGTPFMLDFDQQGNLVAKKLTGDNVVKFNNPTPGTAGYNPNAQSQSTGLSGVALMLSTVA